MIEILIFFTMKLKVPWKHKGLSIKVPCFQSIKKYYVILFSIGI